MPQRKIRGDREAKAKLSPLLRLENHDVLLDVLRPLLAKELPRLACVAKFLAETIRFGRFVGVLARPTKLYAIGGQKDVGEPDSALRSVEVFDETQNTWEAMPPMLTPRANPSAAAAAGKLYVIGGGEDAGVGEVFHPGRRQWGSLPGLPRAYVQVMLASIQEELYCVGKRERERERERERASEREREALFTLISRHLHADLTPLSCSDQAS